MKIYKNWSIPIMLIFCSFLVSCEWPKDPDHTLKNVLHSGKLRVAIIQSPPWVDYTSGNIAGIEIKLISQFAKTLHAEPVWHPLSEEQAVAKIKKHQVDMIIGGLTDKNPWKKYYAITRPYYAGHVMAVPQGENLFLKNLEIFLNNYAPQVLLSPESQDQFNAKSQF